MLALTVTLQLGVHNDPCLAGFPVVYAMGSYIPQTIPASFGYVYVMLHNMGTTPLTLTDFWLQTADGARLRHLGLQDNIPKGQMLAPSAGLNLGFLRHLLTRCLRFATHLTDEQILTAHASTAEGEVVSSPLRLSLDYPTQPLEDVELLDYAPLFIQRGETFRQERRRIRETWGSLANYASLHHSWGLHKAKDAQGRLCWRLREYMPAAGYVWLTTDKLKFQRWAHHQFQPLSEAPGWWELWLSAEALEHGTYVELRVSPPQGGHTVRRVPALAHWVEQDRNNPNQWCARVWDPPNPYVWRHDPPPRPGLFPRVYEAHVGMAQSALGRTRRDDSDAVGSFAAFTAQVLPRIRESGYTTVQLMGVPEHPLYKSFGYQVSSYFAPSSRFGTPDDFKALVDAAHGLGLSVILDITHSHSCPNTEEGIARYDTSRYFFADKENQWGTLSFDYGKEMARRFLLSNCRYWMEEYRVDGFRFDAVGNMIYVDHGFGDDFSHPDRCFYTESGTPRADEYGFLYLGLATTLVHELRPQAITIAEEFSGMPGITSAPEQGGLGFDFRFAMGIPDFWGKFLQEGAEAHGMGALWHEMTNHRIYDNTISYVECHDQSINGKDAMIWRIMGDVMYTGMGVDHHRWDIARGMALYKLMRLVTLSTAHKGYLNFMGAEFGHPEWLDEAEYAHRQWHLADNPHMKYSQLAAFDRQCLRHLVAGHLEDFAWEPLLRLLSEDARILAFERGRLLLVFNFHETEAGHPNIMVTPGKYVELDSTDAPSYGGHANLLATGLEHFSDGTSGIDTQRISLYLPPLTALTLRRT